MAGHGWVARWQARQEPDHTGWPVGRGRIPVGLWQTVQAGIPATGCRIAGGCLATTTCGSWQRTHSGPAKCAAGSIVGKVVRRPTTAWWQVRQRATVPLLGRPTEERSFNERSGTPGVAASGASSTGAGVALGWPASGPWQDWQATPWWGEAVQRSVCPTWHVAQALEPTKTGARLAHASALRP